MLAEGVTIQRLLGQMKKLDASDLHLKVGIPPCYRINGLLRPTQVAPLAPQDAEQLIAPILTDKLRAKFEEVGSLDFATYLEDGDRFRCDIFRSGGHMHAAIRRVKAEIPTYASLHLPAIHGKLIEQTTEGLILIVGVTGSGKSSTVAAMLEHINEMRSENLITIEDPVEYRIIPNKCIVSQREVGIDVPDYATALRFIVRQDPDVIFIGEMRDHDTVLAAIQAAETGHLVFGSLHTADTMQAMSRILEFFAPKDHPFVRGALANTLKAICAQRLLPALAGFESGVVPATEVLLGTQLVKDKIRDAEDTDLPAIIAGSSLLDPGDGMHSLTQSLANLVTKEWVARQVAMDYAPNREALDSVLKGVQVKAQTLVHRVRGGGHS